MAGAKKVRNFQISEICEEIYLAFLEGVTSVSMRQSFNYKVFDITKFLSNMTSSMKEKRS